MPGSRPLTGSQTSRVKSSTPCSKVAAWSSSLLPNIPCRPLFDIATSSASRPIVRPSSPSTEARRIATSRTSARVSATAAAERRGIASHDTVRTIVR